MLPDGGDNFQGIDPTMLTTLMSSMATGVNGAQPTAQSYISQFSRLGLGTGAVQKLLADYAWASSQQPMLQRRYSLASHQPSGDFTDGWTSEGAGALTFATTGAAKQAGTADAKQMQAYLDERDWTGIQKELNAMAANGGDADYMAAFFSQLGPAGLYGLSLYAQGGNDKSSEQQVKEIVGTGLATASFEMNLTDKFLRGIEPADPPAGYVTEEMPGGWDTGALAPFLTEGSFSKQWLQTISPAVLYQKGVEMGQQLPPGYDAIFSAIASNPDYAAQFFQQNSGQLDDYMTDPELYHYLASGQGFGQFLAAATIPQQGNTDAKPFTANAAALVKLFSGGAGTDTSSAVRQVMGAVATYYFSDLVGTVTAAAPGAGSTMGLTASEWGGFVQQAMKDKTTAAYLLTFYSNWRYSQPSDALASNGAGDGYSTPNTSGYWHNLSFGALNYFFLSNYNAAGASAGSDSGGIMQALKDAFNSGAGTLLATVLVTAATGPEGGAALITSDMLTDAGTDALGSLTESGLESAEEHVSDLLSAAQADPVDSNGAPADLDSLQLAWSKQVAQLWEQSGSTAGHVNKEDFKALSYQGQPYDGDPLPYEQQYGGDFLESDGKTIKQVSDMSPQALAAYNAWLQDPAIVKVTAGAFGVPESGQSYSLYYALMHGQGKDGG